MSRRAMLAAAALACTATPLAAQETPKADPKPANADTFDKSKPVIGIAFAATPFGLYVSDVLPGSAAEKAGIAKGDYITHINGIRLMGMELEVATVVLGAAPADFVFTVMSKGEVKVRKAPIPQPTE